MQTDPRGGHRAIGDGNRSNLDDLFPEVYEELRRRAHAYLRGERDGHTLNTTALVNETYIKLLDIQQVRWQDRGHFMALASTAMRRVLVSYARRHRATKRGGAENGRPSDVAELDLNAAAPLSMDRAEEMLALDLALEKLAALNPRLSQTVELRFFGGLTVEEIAEVTNVAESTVKLDWQKAKAWLFRELYAQ